MIRLEWTLQRCKAGDQTGNEWHIIDCYNRPWNCVLRHPLAEVRACIATLAVKAAENNHIGYDQSQRETYGQALKEAGWDPSKITKNVESDCSKGVIDNIKATGNILGIEELKKFDLNPSTASISAWEKNVSLPNAYQFLCLCSVQCDAQCQPVKSVLQRKHIISETDLFHLSVYYEDERGP